VYGMISDEKFYERAEKFALLKNTDNKYFTFEEYQKLIKENQTDKNKSLIYLYANDSDEQHSYIEAAKSKGYDVLLMDGHLDTHFISQMEQKFTESRFVRVDADVVSKLIQKEDAKESTLSGDQQKILSGLFMGALVNKEGFDVTFEDLSESENPLLITQSEFSRRMKDMSAMGGGGMDFYGGLPDRFNLVVNANHPMVIGLLADSEKGLAKDLKSQKEKLESLEGHKAELEKTTEGKKEEEIKQEEKDKLTDVQKKIDGIENKRKEMLEKSGKENSLVCQLIDLALLSNNMLKGENLAKFVKRSIDLI